MTVKTVFATLVGFLGHHADDLDSVAGALSDILAAVPVNAETRAHIDAMITRVRTSAENVANAVEAFGEGDAPEAVTIRESDIETALRNVVASGALDTLIANAVRDYNAKAGSTGSAGVSTAPVAAPTPPANPAPVVGGDTDTGAGGDNGGHGADNTATFEGQPI